MWPKKWGSAANKPQNEAQGSNPQMEYGNKLHPWINFGLVSVPLLRLPHYILSVKAKVGPWAEEKQGPQEKSAHKLRAVIGQDIIFSQ